MDGESRNVFTALPQRRNVNLDCVETKKQVLAKLAGGARCLRSVLVAEITRTSTRRDREDPRRSISPDSSTRKSFACCRSGTFPISSRKIVPPSASSKRPMRSVRASVNAPLTWPKISLSKTPSDRAPVLTATKGGDARETVRGAFVRPLLPAAVLAGNQDVCVRRSDSGDGVENRPHGRAAAMNSGRPAPEGGGFPPPAVRAR